MTPTPDRAVPPSASAPAAPRRAPPDRPGLCRETQAPRGPAACGPPAAAASGAARSSRAHRRRPPDPPDAWWSRALRQARRAMACLWGCCVQLLRALCGDGRRDRAPSDPTEQQKLLAADAGSDVLADTHASVLQSHPPSPGALHSGAPGHTTLIVMRHGHRMDEEQPKWHLSANRPWDPPLSAHGRKQAREAGQLPEVQGVDLVVTSPFKRCLQTSAQVVAQLPRLQQGQWLLDWGLSEVCDPRVLFSGRMDLAEQMKGRPLPTWMWGGLSMDEAVEHFLSTEQHAPALRPEARPRSAAPAFPETLQQGLARYSAALQAIAKAHPGRTILVVTHGECVRQAVAMLQPNSEVFEVKHTAYVVLQQCDDSWQLVTEPGTTGVLWLEE